MIVAGGLLVAVVVFVVWRKRGKGTAATVIRQARPGRVGHRRRGETL